MNYDNWKLESPYETGQNNSIATFKCQLCNEDTEERYFIFSKEAGHRIKVCSICRKIKNPIN